MAINSNKVPARLFTAGLSLERLNAIARGNMVGHLGIEFTEVGPDYLRARMPVDERTRQPYGLLHGGASAALAETLGSVASVLVIDSEAQMPVGVSLEVHHLRSVRSGFVYGTVRPLHVGRRTHVWEIRIVDAEGRLIATSTLTIMVVDRQPG